ncbi:MAG: HDOD domain-containing protein [Polyangiaceae bacterium]|nr:HDOD domain-containing protein [Myxococcales bacterium]MCB9584480.1 HDOD domain-containing protein [Polyangiaceae bacterium]MCB9609323.1 HDOD domain-containing protein [Polyangiaceae bacterium]
MAISKKILEGRIKRLPAFPAAVSELTRLLNDDMAGADDFERVIRVDPGLTASVLRVANSAAFGLRRQVSTVGHAVSLLGLKRIFDISVAGAFEQVLPPTLNGYGIRAEDMWSHSVATAIFADALATRLDLPIRGHVFTAGLLHDCGKLVISEFMEEGRQEIMNRLIAGDAMLQAEQTVLGTDHAVVGEAVIHQWELPEVLAEIVRYHHAPLAVQDPEDRRVVTCVHAATIMAHTLGFGADIGELQRIMDEQACVEAGLDVDLIEDVMANALEEIQALSGSFQPKAA